MVFLAEKIFSFAKAMVAGIEKMVSVMHTIFTMTEAMVTVVKTMVSFAPTMFYRQRTKQCRMFPFAECFLPFFNDK